jgi:hypothetical protein
MKAFVLGAAILWGTAGTAGLLIPGAEPVSVAAVRLVVGGLVLAIGLVMVALPARRHMSRRHTRQAVVPEAAVRVQLDELLV